MGQALYEVAESGAGPLHCMTSDGTIHLEWWHRFRCLLWRAIQFHRRNIHITNHFKSDYSITVGNSTPKGLFEGSATSGVSKREDSTCKVVR